jgi:hypothetical protein
VNTHSLLLHSIAFVRFNFSAFAHYIHSNTCRNTKCTSPLIKHEPTVNHGSRYTAISIVTARPCTMCSSMQPTRLFCVVHTVLSSGRMISTSRRQRHRQLNRQYSYLTCTFYNSVNCSYRILNYVVRRNNFETWTVQEKTFHFEGCIHQKETICSVCK